MKKICETHLLKFEYVCPKCLKPFLKHTNFSSLDEIREYQRINAKKVNLSDKIEQFKIAGIIKTKFIENIVYSILLFYDINKERILNIRFKSYNSPYMKYFPSVLFLNHTDIYLNLIKDLPNYPDFYIVNSSGQIHPFFYGAACDFGLKTEIPVIGFTKNLLFGKIKDNEIEQGVKTIYHRSKLLGYAISKPYSKKFLYISVGNNISLLTALKIFLKIDFKIFSSLSIELNNYITKNR